MCTTERKLFFSPLGFKDGGARGGPAVPACTAAASERQDTNENLKLYFLFVWGLLSGH